MARLRRHLSYANVVSTIALAAALGMGGAYAVDRIGSREIKDNSIRSVDLRNGKAVRGVDVKRNSLGGRAIKEESLAATKIAPVARNFVFECPLTNELTACAEASVRLQRRGRILAIATGSYVTSAESPDGSEAQCEFLRDGAPASETFQIGEEADTTGEHKGSGFAMTFLWPGVPLFPGEYEISLACHRVIGQVTLEDVSLVAVALSGR